MDKEARFKMAIQGREGEWQLCGAGRLRRPSTGFGRWNPLFALSIEKTRLVAWER
jgi:hypothetical protein